MTLTALAVAVAPALTPAPPCPSAGPPTDSAMPASTPVILERLRERVRTLRPELPSEIREGALSMGGELLVRPGVEAILRDGADWIVDVRFAVEIAGDAPGRLEHRIVGIGPDRDAAERAAADDWVGSVGFALLNARDRRMPAWSADELEAYAGLPGSRGVVPVGWVEGSHVHHGRMLAALAPVFRDGVTGSRATGGWATVSLLYMRAGPTGASVDCHVDGVRSEACQQALLSIVWPEEGVYDMLKQVYVLRRARPTRSGRSPGAGPRGASGS